MEEKMESGDQLAMAGQLSVGILPGVWAGASLPNLRCFLGIPDPSKADKSQMGREQFDQPFLPILSRRAFGGRLLLHESYIWSELNRRWKK